MAINPDFRLKIRHFFRDHIKAIIITVAIFLILIIINRFLMNRRYKAEPQTTYTPHKAVLNSKESTVPEKVANDFESFIDEYIKYCNNRNFVEAWNLISEDCKKNFFGNNYDLFVDYVTQKFNGNTKRYAIQNYSNVNDEYIYNVKIFDDYLATGVTNQRVYFQEEKFVVKYDDDKNIVCSVGNYMNNKNLNYMISNDYLRVEVTEVVEKYSYVMYKINFVNRTNYTVVVQDNLSGDWEIGIAIGNEIRPTVDDTNIVLGPGESKTAVLSFEKFYDFSKEPEGIVLNAVRIMENYTGNPETAQNEIENAIDKFSMTIKF